MIGDLSMIQRERSSETFFIYCFSLSSNLRFLKTGTLSSRKRNTYLVVEAISDILRRVERKVLSYK